MVSNTPEAPYPPSQELELVLGLHVSLELQDMSSCAITKHYAGHFF